MSNEIGDDVDWSKFEAEGISPDKAFEAFLGHIFEAWCRREHGDRFRRMTFLDGAGGDGGVEAYATLTDGVEIGMQAKWFRGRLDDARMCKIEKSFGQAIQRHPKLAIYVVCIPKSLSDSKVAKRHQKSESDRWNEFVNRAASEYPDVTIVFWGDAEQRRETLKLPEGAQLLTYWFGAKILDVQELNGILERTLGAWFSQRYFPDLHIKAAFEDAIAWRLQDSRVREPYVAKLERLRSVYGQARREVDRLPHLGLSNAIHETIKPEVSSAAQTLTDVLKVLDLALDALRGGRTAVEDFVGPEPPSQLPIRRLMDSLERTISSSRDLVPLQTCVRGLGVALEGAADLDSAICRLARVRRPLAIIGPPGVGKTHALMATAQSVAADLGWPVLVVPCRDVSPRSSLAEILAKHADRPNWAARECLQALEMAALLAGRGKTESPQREAETPVALIVLDGLEESSAADLWPQRLLELVGLLRAFPRVRLVCSTRVATRDLCIGDALGSFETTWADSLAVPIDKLLDEYCQAFAVDVSAVGPWLPWALRTPLAVRLFAEEHRGRKLRSEGALRTSVHRLLHSKLVRIEAETRIKSREPWDERDRRLVPGLEALIDCYLASGAAVLRNEAVRVVAAAQPYEEGAVAVAISILNAARDHGILDEARVLVRAAAPAGPDFVYQPAFNVITDFLLANRLAAQQLPELTGGGKPDIPPGFDDHPDATAMAASLLADNGFFVIRDGFWRNLPTDLREQLQLRALVDQPRGRALSVRDWVADKLQRSMSDCRQVVNLLVVPACRTPHPFGPKFLDEVLRLMPMAVRDLVWSGPDVLPKNCGGPWEGAEILDVDGLSLLDTETHTMAPLLLAWLLASVVRPRVQRARWQLTKWGRANPMELSCLLRRMLPVDDGQILEHLLMVAADVACRCEAAEPGLAGLAETCDLLFFVDPPLVETTDVVALHCARIVVERAHLLDCPGDSVLTRARPPYTSKRRNWPAIALRDSEVSDPLLTWDLGQYVVKGSLDRFFVVERATPDLEQGLGALSDQILGAALSGTLGLLSTSVADQLVEELARRQERHAKNGRFVADILARVQGDTADAAGPGSRDSTTAGRRIRKAEAIAYGAEAQALLEQYSAAAGRPLSPEALQHALVKARVAEMGWCPEVFHGEPQGGRPGEILGPDVAIARRHDHARHGERSRVATFAEKYVWIAKHEIAGTLAQCLPVRPDSSCAAVPLGDYSVLVHDDLVEAILTPDVEHEPTSVWQPPGLCPPSSVEAVDQLEHAREYLRRLPLPPFEEWLIEHRDGRAWLRVAARVSATDTGSMARPAAWLSTFLVADESVDTFVRDLRGGFVSRRDQCLTTGLGAAVYTSPHLAAWAPWLEADDAVLSHSTIAADGSLLRIDLRALAAQVIWNDGEHERSTMLPAPVLRDALAVVGARQTPRTFTLRDRNRDVVAISGRFEKDDDAPIRLSEFLVARLDAVQRLADSQRARVGAVVRWYCEIPTSLWPRGADVAAMTRDYNIWLLLNGDAFEVVYIVPSP